MFSSLNLYQEITNLDIWGANVIPQKRRGGRGYKYIAHLNFYLPHNSSKGKERGENYIFH